MCKKRRQSAEEQLVDEKEAVSKGDSCSLFSNSEIWRLDRGSAFTLTGLTQTPLTAATLNPALIPSLLSHLPPSCFPAGHLLALPVALPVRQPAGTWSHGGFHSSHRCRRRRCWTTPHSWHCSPRIVFGNPKTSFRWGMPPSQSPSQPLIPNLVSLYLS